jgi:lactate dehydrogenase-like 2-hydroxyacid dehydrogenase
MPPVVVVTEPEYRRSENVFGTTADLTCVPAPPAEDALVEAIRTTGARHAIVGSTFYRGPLYPALPRGSVLARYGVGHENIDKAQATGHGLLCTNTPDVLHQSVAELTMLLIGAAARHLLGISGALMAGRWAPVQGVELEGRTLAIIGCGTIGRTIARIAAAGFGMRVVGYSRRAPGGAPQLGDEHFQLVTDDFAAAVRDADFVSLNIPAYPENLRFLNRERLARFRNDAWLVNTARGAVVDEAALYEAIAEGRLGGAALDVYEKEPYVPVDEAHDLRTLERVVLVPHVGSNTAQANRRMAERALRNVRAGEAGDLARLDLLNPEVLSGQPDR